MLIQVSIAAPRKATSIFARPFLLGGIILLCAFTAIYIATLDTGLQPYELHGGDLITHQYAQVQARPGNAPGYPLYTMGGWLWFHSGHTLFSLFGQPYPNPMPILSSYSTLWALLTLWLLYLILGELLGNTRHTWHGTLLCLLTTAYLGVTYFFWYYATTTEQYSSAIAQTVAIFYVYLLWDKEPERLNLLYFLAFLCGISLANMLTVAFIVPPLVLAVIWRAPSLLRNPRAILTSILAAALPLLSYLYVYYRGALNPQWWGNGHWDTPQAWFWSFISIAQGQDELLWAFEPDQPFLGNGFPQTMWHELTIPLMLLGLIGMAYLPRRQAFVFYGTFLIYLIFCWLYRFGNWYQVILPLYPLILIGIAPIYSRISPRAGQTHPWGYYLLLGTICIALLWRVDQSLPAANSRNRAEDTALNHAAILLDQPLPHNAHVFAAVDDSLAIDYLANIWRTHPGIKTLNSPDANHNLLNGDTIFVTVDALDTLTRELSITPYRDGFSPDWITLSLDRPTSATNFANSGLYTITPELQLVDYSVQPIPDGQPTYDNPQSGMDVGLIWRLPTGIWPANIAISLRPTHQGAPMLDPTTQQPIQLDRPRPLNGQWLDHPLDHSRDEPNAAPILIHDYYRFPQPQTPNERADGLLLILYSQDANGFHNLAEINLPLNK